MQASYTPAVDFQILFACSITSCWQTVQPLISNRKWATNQLSRWAVRDPAQHGRRIHCGRPEPNSSYDWFYCVLRQVTSNKSTSTTRFKPEENNKTHTLAAATAPLTHQMQILLTALKTANVTKSISGACKAKTAFTC